MKSKTDNSLFNSVGIAGKLLLILFIIFAILQFILISPYSYYFGILSSLCFLVTIFLYYKNKNNQLPLNSSHFTPQSNVVQNSTDKKIEVNIKDKQEKKSSWLKGALIGGIITISLYILYFIFMVIVLFSISETTESEKTWVFLVLIVAFFIYIIPAFLIGGILGAIFIKIREKITSKIIRGGIIGGFVGILISIVFLDFKNFLSYLVILIILVIIGFIFGILIGFVIQKVKERKK